MTEHPRPGSGNVVITLLDVHGQPEEFELKPSYQAAKTLSAQSGGLLKLLERIGTLDLDAITQVVALGMGYGTQTRRGPPDLAERIWRTGVDDTSGGLAERCVLYIRVLMAGGRMPSDDDVEEHDGAEDPTGES